MVSHTAQHFADLKTGGTHRSHNYQIDIVFLHKFADILRRLPCLDFYGYFNFFTLGLVISDVALHSFSQSFQIYLMDMLIFLPVLLSVYMKQD